MTDVGADLKGCPFCGVEGILRGEEGNWAIECNNVKCMVTSITADFGNKEGAIAAWNTRASDALLAERDAAWNERDAAWKRIHAEDQLQIDKQRDELLVKNADIIRLRHEALDCTHSRAEMLAAKDAEIERLKWNSYPHMCRDEHVQIGHSDSENERCPLCRANDAFDAQKALVQTLRTALEEAKSAILEDTPKACPYCN